MGYYRKKPVVIEATPWHKNGDHPADYSKQDPNYPPSYRREHNWEGDVVRYYRNPGIPTNSKCKHCAQIMHVHGWIDTLEGGHIVCPGDWIITGVMGEHYPCKPDIFAETYEAVPTREGA